jgi:hypothetical protein
MNNQEQNIQVKTYIKFDFVDALKIIFGRAIEVTTNVAVPQEQPIEYYNAWSETKLVSTTNHFVKQDKPTFGYMAKL